MGSPSAEKGCPPNLNILGERAGKGLRGKKVSPFLYFRELRYRESRQRIKS